MMKGNDQSRSAVTGRPGRRLVTLVLIILSGITVARAQSTANPTARAASPPTTQPDARITSLLIELADQARLSDDLAFATGAQAEAATLLWPYNAERAREIYRRAFASLLLNSSPKSNDRSDAARQPSRASLSASEQQRLRAELLNEIVSRDPELADELARALADSTVNAKVECASDSLAGSCNESSRATPASPASPTTSPTQANIERRELLISVAMQVVEREPQRAMALGQLSLTYGVSQNFSRLLMLMRGTDAGLANLMFAYALARLEQTPAPQLAEIHTLGAYLVEVAYLPTKQAISKTDVINFLQLALNRLTFRTRLAAESKPLTPDESALVYFLKRQLADLFARYQPERRGEALERLNAINDDEGREPLVFPASALSGATTESTSRETHETRNATESSEQRDAIHSMEAILLLNRGDTKSARIATEKISDTEMRDRILNHLARRYVEDNQFEDAVAVVPSIKDDAARVEALVMLADAARAAKDRVRATELLNEAEAVASKAEATIARARSFLKIASAFVTFDAVRSFESMQAAVKAANDISSPPDNDSPSASSPGAKTTARTSRIESLHADFENTLTQLARADFDRALLLAQQLSSKEAAVTAQLAVCRGGLVSEPPKEQAQSVTEIESGANQED